MARLAATTNHRYACRGGREGGRHERRAQENVSRERASIRVRPPFLFDRKRNIEAALDAPMDFELLWDNEVP